MAYIPNESDIEKAYAHLKAQGRMTPSRMTEAVMEATGLNQREAREVNRRLVNRRLVGLGWDGQVEVAGK